MRQEADARADRTIRKFDQWLRTFSGPVLTIDSVAEVILRFHQRRLRDSRMFGEFGVAIVPESLSQIRGRRRCGLHDLIAEIEIALGGRRGNDFVHLAFQLVCQLPRIEFFIAVSYHARRLSNRGARGTRHQSTRHQSTQHQSTQHPAPTHPAREHPAPGTRAPSTRHESTQHPAREHPAPSTKHPAPYNPSRVAPLLCPRARSR
jgi:hypothetical protein